MKKAFFLALLATITLTAEQPQETAAALQSFCELAQQCKASAENATSREAFDAHARIVSLYQEYAKALAAPDSDASRLYAELQHKLAPLLPRRSILIPQQPSESPSESPLITQEPPLTELLTVFKQEHAATLAIPLSTTKLWQRIGLKTIIEMAYNWSKKINRTNSRIPPFGARVKSLIQLQWSAELGEAMEFAIVKSAANLIVDELIPASIRSQQQKIMELVIPTLLSEIIIAQKNNAAVKIPALCLKIIPKLILARGYFDRKHPLYAYVNSAAYVVPFLLGPTLFPYLLGGRHFDAQLRDMQKSLPNVALDGAISMLIFDGIPALVNACLPSPQKPTTFLLHRKSRRTGLGKIARDGLRPVIEALSTAPFA